MATTTATKKTKLPAKVRNEIVAAEVVREDGWNNFYTGLGRYNRDKRVNTNFARGVKLDHLTLEALFHEDDIVGRIVELPAMEMTREWIEIAGDAEAKLANKMQELGIQQAFCEGITWGRLYGGAAIILGVDDGQALDQPLNLDTVRSFDWLHVCDRWDMQIVETKYGEPVMYQFTSTEAAEKAASQHMARVHSSRVLRFEGTLTGRRRRRENQGWSESVVQRVYEVIRDFCQSYAGASALISDFAQAVFQIDGLASMLMSDMDDKVLKRLQHLDLSRSITKAVMLDKTETFERKATPVSGLAELLDKLAARLSAATGIPITLLMGEAPGGLQSTGNSDHRYWYNVVKAQQEKHLRKPLSYLLRMIAKVEGVSPKEGETEFGFSFRPLWQPTEGELSETRLKVAQADAIYIDRGVLDAAEVGVSRFGGDQYSLETTIDQEPPKEHLERDDPDDKQELDKRTGLPADKAVQDTALNGTQLDSFKELVLSAATGELSKDTIRFMIKMAFPGFTDAEVTGLMGTIKDSDIAAGKAKKEAAEQAEREMKAKQFEARTQPPAPPPRPEVKT